MEIVYSVFSQVLYKKSSIKVSADFDSFIHRFFFLPSTDNFEMSQAFKAVRNCEQSEVRDGVFQYQGDFICFLERTNSPVSARS